MDNKFLYPVTERTFREYAKSIFTPIRRGECVTTIWLPMSGRRKHNRFLTENIQLFKSDLLRFDSYVFVYIEPLELTQESVLGYLRLMAKDLISALNKKEGGKEALKDENLGIFDSSSSKYSELFEKLSGLLGNLIQKKWEIVFFIGEFDELTFANRTFYNNLKSLWESLSPSFHYVFLMRETVMNEKNQESWGELSELIMQNIVYVPILAKGDIDYMIKRFKKEFGLRLGRLQIQEIREVCGGHPYLLRVAFRLLSKNAKRKIAKEGLKDFLFNNYELRWVARRIFDIRTPEEKQFLFKVVNLENFDESKYSEARTFLLESGLVSLVNGKLKLFSEIFARTVAGVEKTKLPRGDFNEEGVVGIDPVNGAILFRGKTIEEKFTRQEYSLFSELVRDRGKLVRRDTVGQVLWGKASYEKYSDWAIDQLMSKLRRKIKSLGIDGNITTIKGVGYKFL